MNIKKNISIKPVWDEIEKSRDQLIEFLGEKKLSENTIHSATMIFSELIENGIKYGKFSPGDAVETWVNINDHLITIEVINPVDTEKITHINELDKMIQWIRGFQDPFEAYIEKLKQVSKMPIKNKESGIGLVRIAYEGGGILDFFINEEGKLNVSAVLSY